MIPSSWERKPIKELCDSIIDCVNKTAKHVDYETPYKMIRTTNVRNGRVDTSNVRYVEKDVYDQWIRRGAPKNGDIIFTREAPVGEAGVLEDAEGIFLGQRTMMYRSHPERADNRYLFYSLMSRYCQKQIEDFSNGGTVAHMRVPDCGEIIINAPPLPEQRKIAKTLSTWDKAIATTEKLIATSNQQKKALMQQLLTGKKRLVNPETGRVFEGEWEHKALGDICDVKGGKRLPKGESLQESPNEHPYIRVADMYMGGVSGKNILYVPEQVVASIKRYTISSSDLFITVAGTLGLVGKVPPKLNGANLTENADKLTNISCNQDFLMYVLMSPLIQRYVDAESTQNAQPKLALARIRGFRLALPEIQEQQKIAQVLTAADKEIENLESKLAHFQQEKKALMQQLLTGKRRVKIGEAEAA